MANGIDTTSSHYKGKFASIYEVNQKFPNGGVAGDYVEIDGWAHYWNADRGTWCVNEKRDEYWDELITSVDEAVKQKVDKAELESAIKAQAETDAAQNTEIAKKFDKADVVQTTGDSTEKVMSQKVVTDNLTELQNTVFPLEVSLSLDKTLLEYTGSAQGIRATYSIKRKGSPITPTSLSLSVDGSLVSIDVKQADTVTFNVNKEGDTQVVLTAKKDALVKSATGKVTMVSPIYYGFGTSEADIAITANKLSPRLSASGTYAKTSAKDNVNFIILAPKTLPQLTNFTMGGAPFVMQTSTVTINGRTYYMYKSGAVYMTGANLNVQAN